MNDITTVLGNAASVMAVVDVPEGSTPKLNLAKSNGNVACIGSQINAPYGAVTDAVVKAMTGKMGRNVSLGQVMAVCEEENGVAFLDATQTVALKDAFVR